ncbi:long-chain fatty acid--CoA ligase [Geothermobacter hydrogeniphilus]|uniref:Long-chain fatty acid--CoA ligase n=1 Tax=Geothermobacter hydrogeniphilus TaxID=1969733 RepID=A0A1X0XWW5_9BACT|nr:long-chain fatty acid--CoA ligase [Geothermobacter hydrogeniphilus]ORJ57403.1 long-chain fatty acid--CoA ligase [Geothermobacter hydrogeniphilus]
MKAEYADIKVYDTFPKLLAYNAANWPDEIAMREKEFGIWNAYSWDDYNSLVRRFALGMHKLGIGHGDSVGIIGDNRPEWVAGEIASHALRAMIFGIYQDSMNEECAYLINYAGAKIIIAEDEEQVDKVLEITEQCPCVKHIIYCDPRGMRKYDDPRLLSHIDLMKLGEELDAQQPRLYEQLVAAGRPEDVAILCPTSGTTSNPKLAMLQCGPMLEHCLDYLHNDPKFPTDNYVSVLPLPWIMEQVYAVAQALISRQIVNFVEEPETMMADLREIGPNFVLLAPRVWETVAADVKAKMMDATRFKQKMFNYGMKLAEKAAAEGKGQSKLAYWLLFRALKDRLGFSSLRSAATGGAALGPDTFKFFLAMGVPLRQLYGQTEMGGAYTIHRADDVDFDSVGIPFDTSDVRIDNPDANGVGEVVSKTRGMFLGYYKNDEATAETLEDGWMHTGDAGYFKKENGHLVVIDRISDLAETSTGSRFSPQFIENKLKFSPFIAEAVIQGDGRPYLAAIICIRYEIVAKWAEQRGIAFTNYINLSAQPQVYDMVQKEIEQVNATLPEAQRIRKFLLLYKQLDADDGELTRTRKVRRGVIKEKYAEIIDTIYSDQEIVHIDTVITFQDGNKSRVRTDVRVVDLFPNASRKGAGGKMQTAV